eukprot:3503202-Rhodomonas_salina.1
MRAAGETRECKAGARRAAVFSLAPAFSDLPTCCLDEIFSRQSHGSDWPLFQGTDRIAFKSQHTCFSHQAAGQRSSSSTQQACLMEMCLFGIEEDIDVASH